MHFEARRTGACPISPFSPRSVCQSEKLAPPIAAHTSRHTTSSSPWYVCCQRRSQRSRRPGRRPQSLQATGKCCVAPSYLRATRTCSTTLASRVQPCLAGTGLLCLFVTPQHNHPGPAVRIKGQHLPRENHTVHCTTTRHTHPHTRARARRNRPHGTCSSHGSLGSEPGCTHAFMRPPPPARAWVTPIPAYRTQGSTPRPPRGVPCWLDTKYFESAAGGLAPPPP